MTWPHSSLHYVLRPHEPMSEPPPTVPTAHLFTEATLKTFSVRDLQLERALQED